MTTKLAHELKNPLAAIKSLVQVERARSVDDKSQRRLDVALGEVDRISAILREYLDLARPVEVAHVAPVSLDDLMADVSALLSGRAEAAAVALTVDGTGGAIHADARLLKEAIVNVVNNAIEATPRGGAVDVTYHVGREHTSITVRDTGRGMSREVAARIGTPFFTTREGGTGLGVVIARTAIAQHHGTLEFSSIPGVGTTATIALPQKRASA
jgi:signal transduction histidine kinase